MRNQTSSNQYNQNDDLIKRYQAELQRKFVDLQFKRSKLEKQLKQVNDDLFSLGREMDPNLAYDDFYKWSLKSGELPNLLLRFSYIFLFKKILLAFLECIFKLF